jgi:hypothetical protein
MECAHDCTSSSPGIPALDDSPPFGHSQVAGGSADCGRNLRNDGITVGGNAFITDASHPVGYPIIHSTSPSSSARRCETGEASVPTRPSAPDCSESGREFRAIVASEARSERVSRAVGVGRTLRSICDTDAVSHERSPLRLLPAAISEAFGVGSNEPHPFSSMVRAGIVSTHHERP